MAVATAGTAIGVIAAGAAIGGAAGMVAGGATGAIGAAITGGDVFDGFANGALTGAVVGSVKGAMNAVAPGSGSAGALALAQVGSIVVSSASSAAGSVMGNILFSKNADRYGSSKIGSNGHYNKQFNAFWAQYGNGNLNTKRKFHDYITKKGYDTWKQLLQAWQEFLSRVK